MSTVQTTASKEYDIILLRHGNSQADVEKRYGGMDEDTLTEEGVRQAEAVAGRLACGKIRFDRIIASPLSRAKRTAEIVAGRLGLALTFDPFFRERDNGVMSFQPKKEFDKTHPRPEFESPFWSIEGGESIAELHLRAGVAVVKLVSGEPGKILVVAHGGIINAIVCNMLGIGYCTGVGFKLNDTGFIRIRYKPSQHRWTFIEMNAGA